MADFLLVFSRTCGEDRKCSSVLLSDSLGDMSILEERAKGLDDTFRGMAMSSCERNDPFVTREVRWLINEGVHNGYDHFCRPICQLFQLTNKIFKNPKGYGTDLMMIDIERGRDHGCASYNKYREYCGLGKAKNFEQLIDVMPIEVS